MHGRCILLAHTRLHVRLHYDDVIGKRAPERRRKPGSVFASAAYAHRKQLNQKLILPRRVKEILHRPADEEQWGKLRLLCEAVRCEIEREEDVYLNGEDDIEKLASAVEACQSDKFGDEVGPGFKPIPEGSRLILGVDEKSPDSTVQERRAESASLVRSMRVGTAVSVKMRPMGTSREPPLDRFGKDLMKKSNKAGPFKRLEKIAGDRSVQEMRDLLLLALWDALFLTACEHWTEHKVANTSAADAHELGGWFLRGQDIGKEPLFNGICVGSSERTNAVRCSSYIVHSCIRALTIYPYKAMCGCLLHQYGAHGVSNTCYGPPMNRDGELLRTGTGAPMTKAQPPFLHRP